jgi:hypothetical protein
MHRVIQVQAVVSAKSLNPAFNHLLNHYSNSNIKLKSRQGVAVVPRRSIKAPALDWTSNRLPWNRITCSRCSRCNQCNRCSQWSTSQDPQMCPRSSRIRPRQTIRQTIRRCNSSIQYRSHTLADKFALTILSPLMLASIVILNPLVVHLRKRWPDKI